MYENRASARVIFHYRLYKIFFKVFKVMKLSKPISFEYNRKPTKWIFNTIFLLIYIICRRNKNKLFRNPFSVDTDDIGSTTHTHTDGSRIKLKNNTTFLKLFLRKVLYYFKDIKSFSKKKKKTSWVHIFAY